MPKTLNDFQTQLSESFYSKIYLLEKILGDKHWLTSGTFKEKVLISFLNNNLPKRYKAKSGFIIFPKKRKFKDKEPDGYDSMNNSSYEISRQIDILIYDTLEICPVFEDENIVLLAPEAVKGIIEVKGTLNNKHLDDAIQLLMDFRNKWIDYEQFSKENKIEENLNVPELYIYSWEFKRNSKGNREITGKKIREKLATLLASYASINNLMKVPKIESVYIYNECEISLTYNTIDSKDSSIGYMTTRGRSIIFSDEGVASLGGDKTLFSLLRGILSFNKNLKNRFLIDTDETNRLDILPHIDYGYAKSFNANYRLKH